MAGPSLSYGLNVPKKHLTGGKIAPPKRKPIFGDDNDSGSEDGQEESTALEEISDFGGIPPSSNGKPKLSSTSKSSKPSPFMMDPTSRPKKAPPSSSQYGDLSTAFTSKSHAATAEALDPSIYDYDAVYDTLKPKKTLTAEDAALKPKYMANLLAAATVRKRDATIAEEKKLAREREAEGDEFAGKEKFVTGAYKKQQEENKRLQEEEREREEREEKRNRGGGLVSFHKEALERSERRHEEIMKAAEERGKKGESQAGMGAEEEEVVEEAELARRINAERGEKVTINDDGQVVDKRQLLKGGLNVIAKPKHAQRAPNVGYSAAGERNQGFAFAGSGGGKQAMRERQSRMMEAQLEAASKRALEVEEEEREKVERAAKSRKTEGEIMGAKERYLARKREAEEAKKRGEGG